MDQQQWYFLLQTVATIVCKQFCDIQENNLVLFICMHQPGSIYLHESVFLFNQPLSVLHCQDKQLFPRGTHCSSLAGPPPRTRCQSCSSHQQTQQPPSSGSPPPKDLLGSSPGSPANQHFRYNLTAWKQLFACATT